MSPPSPPSPSQLPSPEMPSPPSPPSQRPTSQPPSSPSPEMPSPTSPQPPSTPPTSSSLQPPSLSPLKLSSSRSPPPSPSQPLSLSVSRLSVSEPPFFPPKLPSPPSPSPSWQLPSPEMPSPTSPHPTSPPSPHPPSPPSPSPLWQLPSPEMHSPTSPQPPSPPSPSPLWQLPSPEMPSPTSTLWQLPSPEMPSPTSPQPSSPPPPSSSLQPPSLSPLESSSSRSPAPSSSQPLSSSRPYVGFDVYLPLSALARSRSVSSLVRSHIRSLPAIHPFPHETFFFLHYSWTILNSVVYNPFYDNWRFLAVPRFPTASSDSHFLITSHSFHNPRDVRLMDSNFSLFNPLSDVTIPMSPPSPSSQLPSPEMSSPTSPQPPSPPPPSSSLQAPSLSPLESSSSRPPAPSSSQPLSPSRPYVGFDVILYEIFRYIPLSALGRFRGVCRLFNSHIRSLSATHPFPRETFFFLHYSWTRQSSVVYNPFCDNWRCLAVPRFPTASSGSHLLITSHSFHNPRVCDARLMVSSFSLFNPFSNVTIAIPRPSLKAGPHHYHGLSLVFDGDNNYRVLAFSECRLALQIYDSRRRYWTYHALSRHIYWISLVNSVFFDGSLYLLTEHPAHLWILDLETEYSTNVWEFPLTECRHLMVLDGRVFVAGWRARTVEVWRLVRREPAEWIFVDRMPPGLLPELSRVWQMRFVYVCSGGGIICFFHSRTDRLVVFDVMARSWRMASQSPYDFDELTWLGCTVEPTIDDIR